MRDELLDREAFASVAEAQVRLGTHRLWYNADSSKSTSGVHLVQKDNSGLATTVRLDPVSLSASTPNGSANVFIAVAPDTRGVTVVTGIAPTYHKGPNNQPVENLHTHGEVLEDTVLPDPGATSSISYGATPDGTWGGNPSQACTYSWQSAVTSAGASGLWHDPYSNLDVPSFPVTYASPPLTQGQVEIATVKLMEPSDGAVAENSAYVHFHERVEGWQRDAGFPKEHPLPTSPSPENQGEWASAGFTVNSSAQSYTLEDSVQGTRTYTNTGEISDGGSIGLDAKVVNASFEANEKFTNGQTYSIASTQTAKFPIDAHTRTYKYWSFAWQERRGTCDIYGINGFQRVSAWSANVWDTAAGGGQLAIVTAVHPVPIL